MASSQQRTVLLCEENLVLGHLLGYRYEQVRESGGVILPEKLRHLEKLEGFLMRDVLFVSIDISPANDSLNTLLPDTYCIGISILDTRSLTKPIDTAEEAKAAIQSYQYVTGDSRICRWAAETFRFGETSCTELPEVARKIAWLTRDRKYILVELEAKRSCEFLKHLDWKITERACFELDTLKAAQHPLQLRHRRSLRFILETFGIKCHRLVAPGNHAHLILRAMLLLAVRDWKMTVDTLAAANRKLQRRLLRVAKHPLPPARSASPQIYTEPPLPNFPDEEDERDEGEESWFIVPVDEDQNPAS